MSSEDRPPRDWPELAERAAATGQPWADDLTSRVETFLAITDIVDAQVSSAMIEPVLGSRSHRRSMGR